MPEARRIDMRCLPRALVMASLFIASARAADAPPPVTPGIPDPSGSAASATPTPAPPPPAAPPAPATVLEKGDIQGVLGKDVRSSADENMGRIVDVIVDKSGRARAAVIDFGGFLGVGSRKIAVDWGALQFSPNDKSSQVTLNLTRDQVRAAPEYKEGKQAVVLGASGITEPMSDN
jgi:hypothetical protein